MKLTITTLTAIVILLGAIVWLQMDARNARIEKSRKEEATERDNQTTLRAEAMAHELADIQTAGNLHNDLTAALAGGRITRSNYNQLKIKLQEAEANSYAQAVEYIKNYPGIVEGIQAELKAKIITLEQATELRIGASNAYEAALVISKNSPQ